MARGIIHFVKKYKLLAGILALGAIVAAIVVVAKAQNAPKYETTVVRRGTVTQEVSVTGQVVPVRDVSLSFERGGTISRILKGVGDNVAAGDVIVSLDSGELAAQLAQAQAQLASQKAKLDEMKQGPRPEEVAVSQAQLSSAQVALAESGQGIVHAIPAAYTVADDAVRNSLDQIFTNPRSTTPQVSFLMSDTSLEGQIESQRVIVEFRLVAWNASLATFSAASDFPAYLAQAEQALADVKTLLDLSALAANGLSPYGTITQTTITGWKTAIAGARTDVNASITNVSGAENAWKTAQADVAVAQTKLDLTKAGSTAEQIASQAALVDQAQASADNIKLQMDKMSVRAPFDGIVTRQDAKVGEVASAGASFASVISGGQYEIESDIAEVDIAKIAAGNTAQVTLDAYGSDVKFGAHVVSIDPAEIIKEGVATYKTTLQFDRADSRVRSGMTANIDILAARKDNVLYVPQRVVATQGEAKYVTVFANGTTQQVLVQTGLRGSDGNIEIVSGLAEGEQVVVSVTR